MAAFPRLTRSATWPAGYGRRAILIAITLDVVLRIAASIWLVPHIRRLAERRRVAEEELKRELGRDPTEKEVMDRLLTEDRRMRA